MYPDPVDHPDEISTSRLMLVAILLCNGNARLRAEVLWNVIQEGDITFISAADKDFYPAFQDMLEIGILSLHQFAKDQEQNNWLAKNIKLANIYRMHENFIDIVFGVQSKVDKEIWLETVSSEVPWILKPETMRVYAYELMHL